MDKFDGVILGIASRSIQQGEFIRHGDIIKHGVIIYERRRIPWHRRLWRWVTGLWRQKWGR